MEKEKGGAVEKEEGGGEPIPDVCDCQCEKTAESHVTIVKSITVPVPSVICYLYRRFTVSMKFLEMPLLASFAATAVIAVQCIDTAGSLLLLDHVYAVKLVEVHDRRREDVGEVVPGLETVIELKHLGLNGIVGALNGMNG